MPWTHFRPTPAQIVEGCEEIRENWDEATHRQRWVRPISICWTPPEVHPAFQLEDDRTRDAWVTSSYCAD